MSDYICPHNCAYRTNAGYCGMTGGYESCQYIKYLEKLEKEKTNIKPYAGKRTNYDRIKAMSVEEMAVFMAANQGVTAFDGSGNLFERWLDWLRQEAE